MDQVVLENIKVYAFHGCMDEEAKIGSDYIVSLCVNTDLGMPAASDKLEDTVDYVDLLKIVNNKIFNGARIVKNENLNLAKLNPTLSFK